MSKERLRILEMVSKGKITPAEAESLLQAVDNKSGSEPMGEVIRRDLPKFLKVKVESVSDDNVDVKVPLSLIRAGMRLTALIPPPAMERINESLKKQGMSIDLGNLKKEDIEALIEGLVEMEVHVDSKNGDKTHVYCE
jgi:hypothetical protein